MVTKKNGFGNRERRSTNKVGGINMVIGFIGTGSMGSVLVHALVRSNAVKPEDLIIHNRTSRKAEALAELNPGIRISHSMIETAVSSDLLFLCVKPLEYKSVLDKIALFMRREQLLISITSPVMIRHLEDAVSCKVAKVIPSLTNYVRSGATLCMYGKRMTDPDIQLVESLLRHISTPIRISESVARVSSDISSVGPAFIAFFVEQLIDAACQLTEISRLEATHLASEMVAGAGQLLTIGGFTPQSLQERISVPGGITERALQLLRDQTNGLFEQVIRATHDKFNEDVTKVEAMLSE